MIGWRKSGFEERDLWMRVGVVQRLRKFEDRGLFSWRNNALFEEIMKRWR